MIRGCLTRLTDAGNMCLCRQHAFGQDEFHPQSETGSEWFGLGLTIIDSLDTLMIMGLTEEVAACRAWIAKDIKMDQVRPDCHACSIMSKLWTMLGT